MPLRYRNALMHRQRIRESAATYFPMGGRLTLAAFVVVGFLFFVARMLG